MKSQQQITVADRLKAIDGFTTKFRDHLLHAPGAVLPPTLRSAVVQYALRASSCSSCAEGLPFGACMRPGADLYALIEKIDHGFVVENNNISEEVKKVLLTTVHSIVNHQGRLNQGWYESVTQRILTTTGILPSEIVDKDKKQYLAYVAFSEILLLAVMSHTLSVAFMLMDRPLPTLPALEDMKSEPMVLDWTSILKRAPRHDEKVCFARYNYPGDFNQRSPDFERISREAWTAMKSMMDPLDPCLPVAYATNDTVLFKELSEVYFVPQKDFMKLYSTELDPTVRLASSFTRYEAELVATAVAEAYNCRFWQEAHGTFQRITKPQVMVPGREEALRNMVQAVTTRPIDPISVSKARAVLQAEHGEGTLVEAAVCLAFFEGMTKITDSTGKLPASSLIWTIMIVVFSILRFLYEMALRACGSTR